MANRYLKRHSTSLAIGKMQIKAVGMSVTTKTNTGKNVGQGASHFPLVGKSVCALTMGINMEIQEKIKKNLHTGQLHHSYVYAQGALSQHACELFVVVKKKNQFLPIAIGTHQ